MSSKTLRAEFDDAKFRIEVLLKQWTVYLEESRNIPTDAEGKIRALLGKSSLLVNDKFKQFTDLLDKYDSGDAVGPKMLITDLQGFWELLLIQVEETFGKFEVLGDLEMANWEKPVVFHVMGTHKSSPGPSTTATQLADAGKGDPRNRLGKQQQESSNED